MTKIKTNRNNTNNVPPLRFPEFSGEWNSCIRYFLLLERKYPFYFGGSNAQALYYRF